MQSSVRLMIKLPFDETRHALSMYRQHTAAVQCSNPQVPFLLLSDDSFYVFNQYQAVLHFDHLRYFISHSLFQSLSFVQGVIIFDSRVTIALPANSSEKSSSTPKAQKKVSQSVPSQTPRASAAKAIWEEEVIDLREVLASDGVATTKSPPVTSKSNASSASAELSQESHARTECEVKNLCV